MSAVMTTSERAERVDLAVEAEASRLRYQDALERWYDRERQGLPGNDPAEYDLLRTLKTVADQAAQELGDLWEREAPDRSLHEWLDLDTRSIAATVIAEARR